jgi:hypothetical protein
MVDTNGRRRNSHLMGQNYSTQKQISSAEETEQL